MNAKSPSFPFLTAAEPSVPRTVGVVLLVVGGSSLSEYKKAVCYMLLTSAL